MKKRILSILLALVMLLSLLPTVAFAKGGDRIAARASAGGTVAKTPSDAPDWECMPGNSLYDGDVTCTLSADGRTLTLSWTDYKGNPQTKSYTATAQTGWEFNNWTYTVGGADSSVLASGEKLTTEVLTSNQVVFTANFVHKHDGITFQPWGDADDGDEDGEITGLPTEAGNYYLTDDVTIDSSWNVHWGTTNLCLNGHVIKLELAALDAQNTGSVIIIPDSATLTIYDCNTTAEHYFYEDDGLWVLDDTLGADSADHIVIGGVITGGTGKQTSTLPIGGGVTNRGTFILNSGSIVGNTTTGEGGGVENNYNKIFTMNGGMICGNTARRGGGVLNLGEKMVMTGGVISDNRAYSGGGVCNSGPVIIMTGGKISGNIATSMGGGIENYDGEVILGGKAVVAGNFKNSTTPSDVEYHHDEDEEDWAPIVRISSETPPADGMYVGLIGNDTTVLNASSGDVKYFFADDPTRYVAFDNKGTAGDTSDDILKLAELSGKKKVSVSQPANGTVYTDKQAAANGDPVTVTAVPNDGYVLKSVSYNDGAEDHEVLKNGSTYQFDMPGDNVTVTAEFVTNWCALNAALAGTQGTVSGVFTVENDTPETGVRTITLLTDFTAGENDSALVVPFEEKVVLDLNGHVLDRNLTDKSAAYFEEYSNRTGDYLEEIGNVITMVEDADLTIKDSNTGSLTHKFTVLTSGENKGLWTLDEENGTEEVTGGVITGGMAWRGGVLVGRNNGVGDAFATSTPGSFTLEGGSIVGNINTAEGHGGGGIFVSEGTVTMNGGAITGNYAKGSGGSCHGGGVFVADRQNFVMNGGTIRDNIADTSGGGVFVSYGAKFTMNGGSIKDNRCLGNNEYSVGGGIYVNGGTYLGFEGDPAAFTMTDGEISGNEALDGGGIYADGGTITLKGGSITGNEAVGITEDMREDWSAPGGRGGGIYLHGIYDSTCAFDMSGGSITGNIASGTGSYGGALVADYGTEAAISAGEISGNQAGTGAGIWAVSAATKLDLTAASGKTITVTGNEATESHLGAGVYCDYNETKLSGELLIKENTYSGEGKETKTPVDLAVYYISYPNVVPPLTVSGALTGSEIHASLIKDEYDEVLEDDLTVLAAGVLTDGYADNSGKTSGAVDEFIHYIGTEDFKMILNGDGELEVIQKGSIYNSTPESDKNINNGYISVPEKAFPGDTITVTVVPNSGYQLESLYYYNNDEGSEYGITDTKTFVMPVYGADVYAAFEETSEPTPPPAPAPSFDSTPTVTVPVSGDGNKVNVSASVSGNTATVKAITDAELDKVTGGEAVEIDLTGLRKDIDTAKIPTETVKKIGDKGGMSVKLTTATVTFDKTATQEISAQAGGSTIQLVVDNIKEVSLNAVQKEAVGKLDTALIIDAYLVSNGTRLCSADKGGFGGGKATVALPFEIKNNRTSANYSVYYVDDAGNLEKLSAKYDSKLSAFLFDITHFSNYVVAYDENAALAFTDVPADKYFYDAVKWAAASGITEGTSATTFSPYAPVTRAQVVTFLWRTAGCPEPTGDASRFADVETGSYYEKAVAWAIEQVITKGTSETTFTPDAVCTRGQIVTFLARFAGVKDEDTGYTHGFTDVNAADYFNNAVAWAKDNGVTEGTSTTTFSPNVDCTRAQVVTFLWRWAVR